MCLIKLNLSITLLFVVYHLWVKKERNFQFSRIYLLGGVIISLLAPLLVMLPQGQNAELLNYSLPVINVVAESVEKSQQVGINYQVLYYLYFLLTAAFGFFFLMGVLRVITNLKKAEKQIIADRIVWVVPFSNLHFTFLNKIVISRDTPKGELIHIMQYEATHQKQLHSIDLILIELVKIFFWYNPIIWLYKRAMVENHEFLADQSAASKNKNEYQGWLLNGVLQGFSPVLVNQFFNQSLIKTRIKMLQKPTNSKTTLLVKGVAVFATAATLLISCGNQNLEPAEAIEEIAKTEKLLQAAEFDKMAEFPGGMEALIEFFQSNLNYPEQAKAEGIEGKVFISFVVKESGKLEGFEVVKSADESLDAAALDIIQAMPNWTPAEKNGKPVAMKMTLPVNFALTN